MSNSILPSFPVFFDNSDERLEGGYIYIGVPNQNPETTPQQAYWDKDLTQTADQPIRTVNGRPALNGSPKNVYVSGDYSITIRDSQSQLVYTVPEVQLSFGGIYTSNVQFNTVSDLKNDTNSYDVGTYVRVKNGDFTYIVVASSGHIQNSATSPVEFNVLPDHNGYNVKAFGAKGDAVTDDTSAISTAFSAASDGGVYFPSGTYITSSVITLGNGNARRILGEGRYVTEIRNGTSDVFSITSNDAAYLNMSDLTIRSTSGGGHCFSIETNSSMMMFSNLVVRQDNAGKSLWSQLSGYCGNVTWEQCRFIPNSSTNLTAHPFNINSDQIVNGWVIQNCRTEKTLGTLQFFNINTTNTSSFITNCLFDNITFQEPYGGMFKLGACRAVTINNCASYDQTQAQTGDGIIIGSSNGGNISSRCTIKNVGRYPSTGGTLGAGVKDILLSSGAAANCVIEGCFNSVAGATFTVDYGNNKTLHIDRPSDGESSYSNDANVIYIDMNGDREGIQAPAYRTTGGTSSRELTISSGSVTPTKNYHTIDTEGNAATDDLDTIVGSNFFEGDILTIRSASTRQVVVKDQTGNIFLEGDFTLNNVVDTLQLLWNGSNWQEISRSNNA